MEAKCVPLDTLTPEYSSVGYGELGRQGSLGYEGKAVSVQGRAYVRALSAHPPSRLRYALSGRYARFQCQVAINEDVAPGASCADFLVYADGRLIGAARNVGAGEPPRELCADCRGAQRLELAVQTGRWHFCHAVWLDPGVSEVGERVGETTLVDCLARTEILLPAPAPSVERCIATLATPGFAGLLETMLASLQDKGNCRDAALVVFCLDDNGSCERIAASYGARIIRCRSRAAINPMSKSLLYSVARVVEARQYLCLDADLLILESLRPLFARLDACLEGSILACREGNGEGGSSLASMISVIYAGHERDIVRILGAPGNEGAYPLVVNDGLFAGNRAALLALDACLRAMPQAVAWINERRDISWRNQFLFNLALAHLDCGVELEGDYNVQLQVQSVEAVCAPGRVGASWRGKPVRALHFNGIGRRKYPEWRERIARAANDANRGTRG